jgi:ligand-binding SRPBCC domain-containing protein
MLRQIVRRVAAAPADDSRPISGLYQVHRDVVIPTTLDETFAFFSAATNLERLTPPWLNFRIRTPLPIEMRQGLMIEYEIVLYGLPIPWLTRIDVWEPGVRFVDRQIRGPYRWWHHEHRFDAVAGGTRVRDDVEFAPRMGWLTGAKVRRDVEKIFAYRQEILPALLRGLR